MKLMAAILTLVLFMSAPVKAEPCDPDDAPCITRKALEFKYKADALAEENKMLRNELDEERNRSDNRAWTFLAGGIVFLGFFGGFVTLYKAVK